MSTPILSLIPTNGPLYLRGQAKIPKLLSKTSNCSVHHINHRWANGSYCFASHVDSTRLYAPSGSPFTSSSTMLMLMVMVMVMLMIVFGSWLLRSTVPFISVEDETWNTFGSVLCHYYFYVALFLLLLLLLLLLFVNRFRFNYKSCDAKRWDLTTTSSLLSILIEDKRMKNIESSNRSIMILIQPLHSIFKSP